MATELTPLLLDKEDKEKAKRLGINLSELCRNAIRTTLSIQQGDVTGVSIELTKKRDEELRAKINELQIEHRGILAQLEKFKEVQKQEEIKQLEEEKESIEKQVKCQNCGEFVGEKVKKHPFPIGSICNGCFLTATNDQIKKWNQRK